MKCRANQFFADERKNMKDDTLDRRIKYTKNQLKSAMVTLLGERHISKISVKSLCEVADVNRSTFYSHYKDQYDLLEQIRREALENIRRYLEDYSNTGDMSVSEKNLKMILEYGKSNAELFKAFLSDNCDIAFKEDVMELLRIVPSSFGSISPGKTRDYITVLMLTGCISILQRWLQEGMPESTREMSKMIMTVLQAINHGFDKFRNI